VYEQAPAIDRGAPALERLRRGEIDVVTLTSPNIAKAFLTVCDDVVRERLRKGTTRLLANSERLKRQLADDGFSAAVSADPTMDGLLAALATISRPGRH
jgi:uroporphyrinogen-III synthase